MATLIYTEQAGDKLKLLAEVADDDVAMAVDALLDAEPKLASQQPFVCFSTDARIVVEAEEEVVQPRRRIKMNGKLGEGAPQRKARTPRKAAAASDDTEEAAPKRRGRPPGTKNKTAAVATDGDAPKRRGRPPGSKNKTTTAKAADTGEAPKRRGRPPGSKNKTTTAAKSAGKKTAIKTPFTRNAASDE